jgi:hypothetical protein
VCISRRSPRFVNLVLHSVHSQPFDCLHYIPTLHCCLGTIGNTDIRQYEALHSIGSSLILTGYSERTWWRWNIHHRQHGLSRVCFFSATFSQGILLTTLIRWSPYNSASGQKSIQRQYSTFDPLLTADLSVSISLPKAKLFLTYFKESSHSLQQPRCHRHWSLRHCSCRCDHQDTLGSVDTSTSVYHGLHGQVPCRWLQ